ncbi:cytochrome b5-like heme/steroid binding domain-containing protein, partial [Mycena alexandri]
MSEKIVTHAELKANSTKEKVWLLLHGKVYDATAFADEHPGGDDAIFAVAGRDSTEEFEDAGHSKDARELLDEMLVGTIEASVR